MSQGEHLGERAIVVGGGMGGLFSARVLSDHFDEVIVLDRASTGRGLDGVAMEFFPIAEEWVRGPWILAAMSDFANPKCTGDLPDADLPDLMALGQAAAATDASPEVLQPVNDAGTLRKPLSAIRTLAPA